MTTDLPPAGSPKRGPTALWPRLRSMLPLLAIAAAGALIGGWAEPWWLVGLLPAAWWLAGRAVAASAALPAGAAPTHAAAALTSQVVPIWQRSINAARQESDRSTAVLLESFAELSGTLDTAVAQGNTELGATSVDELLAQQQDQVQALTASARRIAAMKDDMATGVMDMGATLQELQRLARTVQSISRATHLLALNASVEASRAGSGGSGFAVIAQEVRELATQSRSAGQQIGQRVTTLLERIQSLRDQVARCDTDEDELLRCAEEQARTMVSSVISRVSAHMQASAHLRETGVAVQTELEKISMSLQSQDRQSQMLSSATDDMARYIAWLAGNDDPAAMTPVDWLARLEASYTMEEMRSTHHGTVKIDRQAGVEFF